MANRNLIDTRHALPDDFTAENTKVIVLGIGEPLS